MSSTLHVEQRDGLHVEFAAQLVEVVDDLEPLALNPTSWFITHGLGGPAEGTFTEVAFAPGEPTNLEHVVEPVVREVARQLYGDRYAFTYPPEQYESAIGRHGLRRRERVVVEGIEVLS